MNLKTLQFVEALSTPYLYKWESKDDEEAVATFKTEDGRPIAVEINSIDSLRGHEITFSDHSTWGGTYGLTKGGDAFRILSTVLKIIDEYVKKYHEYIEELVFSGEKSPRQKRKGDSGRQRVYERLFKKYSPPGNWKRSMKNQGWKTEFIYTKIS